MTNDRRLTLALVEQGLGLAYAFEPAVKEELRTGRLVRVLEEYAPTVPGFFLYFPSRAQRSGPLRLFAKTLGVSTSDYSLWGSSAGARMAAAIGSHGVAIYGGSKLPKPAAIVTAYTAHSDHSSDEPATFVVVGERDGIAPPSIMERRVAALRRSGTDVEYRRYPDLGHGFGPGVGTSAEGWIGEATRFWERFIRKQN